MTTTSLIVEILVIGVTFLFGVFLIFYGCTDICLEYIKTLSGWCTLILFITIAIAYSLGWAVNALTFYFTLKFFERKMIRSSFKRNDIKDNEELHNFFRDVHTRLLQKGSPAFNLHMANELAAIRIARCGVLNFFLISIGLLLFPYASKVCGFLAFLIMAFFVYMFLNKSKQYFDRLAIAYLTLDDSTPGKGIQSIS